ncbi:O-succinylbenzoate synthase, partial [Kibdelosporangium lantanae]
LEVAEACGLPCVVSSALETSVGLAAQLALAGALPSLDFACGLGTTSLLAGDVVAESYVPVDGYLPVPLRPPAPVFTRFAADEERTAWWRARLSRVGA